MTSLIVFSSRRHCSPMNEVFFVQASTKFASHMRNSRQIWYDGNLARSGAKQLSQLSQRRFFNYYVVHRSVSQYLKIYIICTFFSVLSLQQRFEIVVNHQWSFRISRDHAINELRNNMARLSTAKKKWCGEFPTKNSTALGSGMHTWYVGRKGIKPMKFTIRQTLLRHVLDYRIP